MSAHDTAVPVPVEQYRKLLADSFALDSLAGYLGRPLEPGEDAVRVVEAVRAKVMAVRPAE